MKNLILLSISFLFVFSSYSQKKKTDKPRILISTDIGGTDPDDNQSMIHFLMYSDLFETEGLISSPSFGFGSKQNILEMIDLYEKDLPKLLKHSSAFPSPKYLRSICKQGRYGRAPYCGYAKQTEGSEWMVKCAKKKSKKPLWVLVWGGLDDLAQALHDAPEIQNNIKVYWIGGPNKKWCANSYAYIVSNFPDLWFIEANATYRGFFSNTNSPDSLTCENYYDNFIKGSGAMGKAFKNYYKGNIKMGDTPSLLYLMHGNPKNPEGESWGGSFEKMSFSPKYLINLKDTLTDTVGVYSVAEFHLDGPKTNLPLDSACFTMTVFAGVGEQKWDGYYQGNGKFALRYIPKQSETFTYKITSAIPGFPEKNGKIVVNNSWPGKQSGKDYKLGLNWHTDRAEPHLFDGKWQGAVTLLKWRSEILKDWANRWKWLSNE